MYLSSIFPFCKNLYIPLMYDPIIIKHYFFGIGIKYLQVPDSHFVIYLQKCDNPSPPFMFSPTRPSSIYSPQPQNTPLRVIPQIIPKGG